MDRALPITHADLGRRVWHRSTRRFGTLESVGGVMADVRFDDGRLQLCSKTQLDWAERSPRAMELVDDGSTPFADAATFELAVDALSSFTDADTNAPDSSFDAGGGDFGGGGAAGDW